MQGQADLSLSPHPTGDPAYKTENRQSIVITLVPATITFHTHVGTQRPSLGELLEGVEVHIHISCVCVCNGIWN